MYFIVPAHLHGEKSGLDIKSVSSERQILHRGTAEFKLVSEALLIIKVFFDSGEISLGLGTSSLVIYKSGAMLIDASSCSMC